MAELKKLATLVCGGGEVDTAQGDCELSKILLHLRTILVSILGELNALGAQSPERISLYGPFLTRSLLEVAVTALIGRLSDHKIQLLQTAGYATVGALVDAPDADLDAIYGIGEATLVKIRNVLGQAIWM